MKHFALFLFCSIFVVSTAYKDYTGHKVLTITLKSKKDFQLLNQLREHHSVDLWNDFTSADTPVMVSLRPESIEPVETILKNHSLKYDVAFPNLQRAIEAERALYAPMSMSKSLEKFDFGKYHRYEEIVKLLKYLSSKYPRIATLQQIGKSYEERPIYNMRISCGESSEKPAILIECGIHSREWISVAAGIYMINKIITSYGSDPEITSFVDNYEINIIVSANPDGYVYTWTGDRMWRKTRSKSRNDRSGVCLGADANRNFDIDFGGVGTSHKPCDSTYHGDTPFSESETRALRDIMIAKRHRLKVYFALHSFSQFWMTPYGIRKTLPPNYAELSRIGKAGVKALSKKYGTLYKFGTISNVIYSATGSSIDYIYEKLGVKLAFVLELRDKGAHGFMLPENQVLPTCEETWDGIKATIQAA